MNLKKKKIIIFGGSGFIGSNLCHDLINTGAKISIFDSFDKDSGSNYRNIFEIKNDIEIIKKDIRSFNDVLKAVKNNDIVINCAASTSHYISMIRPKENLDINVQGTLNILESIKSFDRDKRFIHLSTSTQIGKLTKKFADENHSEFPTDLYSANKMISEKYTLIYSNFYSLNATVLRLGNIYGPRAAIHSPNYTFNNFFIGQALQNKNIQIYKPGNQKRNLLYVDDVVDAIKSSIINKKTAKKIFFVVGNKHYSVVQIGNKISEIIGGKVKLIDWPQEREKIEIGDSILNNKKFSITTNWKPKTNLKDGLIKTKEYFQDKLKHYVKK